MQIADAICKGLPLALAGLCSTLGGAASGTSYPATVTQVKRPCGEIQKLVGKFCGPILTCCSALLEHISVGKEIKLVAN